jgi:hypothetical protein
MLGGTTMHSWTDAGLPACLPAQGHAAALLVCPSDIGAGWTQPPAYLMPATGFEYTFAVQLFLFIIAPCNPKISQHGKK